MSFAAIIPLVQQATPVVRIADRTSMLSGIAAICSAVAWPVLIGFVLLLFRRQAIDLLQAAVGVATGATRFRIWQIEFDRDVNQQVAQSESAALREPPVTASAVAAETKTAANIPSGEVAAAARVRSLLDAAPNTTMRKEMEGAVRARMLGFAQEYETTRSAMPAGPNRTRAMNGVVAKMRTMALAADFLLDELMAAAGSPGRRLAAICILQMKPELRTVPWLADRMRLEQPFVFFHAAVALLNAVRRFGASDRAVLAPALDRARSQVQSFGENADANTVRTLTLASSELEVGS